MSETCFPDLNDVFLSLKNRILKSTDGIEHRTAPLPIRPGDSMCMVKSMIAETEWATLRSDGLEC